MDAIVTDEVWRQLDPGAGQLSRRTMTRLRLVVAAAVVIAVAVAVVLQTGAIYPQLDVGPNHGADWGTATREISRQFTIVNRGWAPVTVTGVGRAGPGLELTNVDAVLPTTLKAGDALSVKLHYQITDCASVPADPWPVPVRVARAWGELTTYLDLPTDYGPISTPDRGTITNGHLMQWQRFLAESACGAP